jgi:ABC transporter substrate binding protein
MVAGRRRSRARLCGGTGGARPRRYSRQHDFSCCGAQTSHSFHSSRFVIVNDPVAQGLVSSVAHPGENITGFSYIDFSVVGKATQLLTKAAPSVTRVGFMFNPETYPYYEVYLRSLQAAASTMKLEVAPARIRSDAEIAEEIAKLAVGPGGGLVVPPEPFAFFHREPDHQVGSAKRAACYLWCSRNRRRRRPDVIRAKPDGYLPPLSSLC